MKTAHEALVAAQHVLREVKSTEAEVLALAQDIMTVDEHFATQIKAGICATYAKSAKALGLPDHAATDADVYFQRVVHALVAGMVTSLALHVWSRDFQEESGAA